MPSQNHYLDLAVEWMANQEPDTEIEIHVDLHEVNWIKLRSIEAADGVVTCEYQRLAWPTNETMVFPIEKITAARKRPTIKLPF